MAAFHLSRMDSAPSSTTRPILRGHAVDQLRPTDIKHSNLQAGMAAAESRGSRTWLSLPAHPASFVLVGLIRRAPPPLRPTTLSAPTISWVAAPNLQALVTMQGICSTE